jgi:hypothetical protein
MADHAIPGLEASDIGSDLDNFTSDVLAEDGGIVHRPPGLTLKAAIDRVDCHCVIFD